MKRACLLFALAACAAEPDIEYTGEARRFVVDSIAVPKNNTEARQFGADLNGDRTVDNQLGMVIATLSGFAGDITMHPNDMIRSGAIASSVELVANDFASDDTVALRYFGADGEHAELVGGALTDGRFTTETGGTAIVRLPVFVDSDPIVVRLNNLHATLLADGHGGFDANFAGLIEADEAHGAAFAGVQQMFASRPNDHLIFFHMLDTMPKDFTVTQQEFEKNSIIVSLLAPDVTHDGKQMLSIGFHVHLAPCAEGACSPGPVASCFDRVRNADETDIDCGGSCGACAAGALCADAADCQSASCNGTCAAPSCSDGVKDGLETDVDCGNQCGGCAVGLVCLASSDCASGQCGAPCTSTWCDLSFDRCR